MDLRGAALSVLAGLSLMGASAGAQEQKHFDIEEFRVEGNTLLPAAMIETAVTPFLGPDRTADDVDKARAALDGLYAQQGYPTVAAEIPQQDPSDGVVILHVTERRVGRLRVHGSRYFSLQEIRDSVPSLAEGVVPNFNKVQHEIVALNQWPDRRVTPTLKPGVVPGTVDVDLDVKDTLPLHGSVELNNQQSADTTPLRTVTSLSYGNLWQRGDSVSVSYQVAPEDPSNTEVFTSSYLFRIPHSNLSILASYLYSNSNVATVGSTNVLGKGSIYGLRLQIPLGTEGPFSHSLSVGVDYKDFLDTVLLAGQQTATPVTYAPLVAQYQASWTGETSETLLSSEVVLGTRGIGSDAQQFDQKRYSATPGFSYIRGDFSRRDDLPLGWQTSVHLSGQVSADALISNEQYSIGGVSTVRGYLESEALGDTGGSIQAELRGPAAVNLLASNNETRGFVFADAGGVTIHMPLPQQRRSTGLASIGVGLRMHLVDNFDVDLIGAHVVEPGPITPDGTTRFLFRVNGAF